MANERMIIFIQMVICFIAVIISFIFASTVSLGSDESYTYINYVYPSIMDSIHRVQLLNNHILNSLLIRLTEYITGEKYSEFVIRLPNLIAHIIYAIFAFLFAREFKYRTLALILLMCNWELTRYFGMARGYGLAACGVLAASYFLYQWVYNTRHVHLYLLCMTALSFALLANSVTLYITISMLLIVVYYLVRNHELINYIKIKFNILFVLIFIFSVLFTFWVSRKAHVTYATQEFYNGFLLSIPIMFTPKVVFDDIIILSFICIFIYGLIYSEKKLFHIITINFIVISLLVNLIFNKGYPLNRGMLPFYPVVALVIVQSLQCVKIIKIVYIIFSIFLFTHYLQNIKFDTSDLWACKREALHYIASHDIMKNRQDVFACFESRDISCRFYLEKFYYDIDNTNKR